MGAVTALRRIGGKGAKRMLLTFVGLAVALYLLVVVSLYLFQRNLIYHPDATHFTPAEAGLSDVREVKLDTPDGERLVAWWRPASPGQPTLLYFHGNGSRLIYLADRIKYFASIGLGGFIPAYRGYSGSSGEPSERALIADSALAYDYLRKAGIAPNDIIAYGESLGTGVAVQLAAAKTVGALILESPYTSLPDIGKRLYPFVPVETFMVDRFDSKKYIGEVRAPILILHGTNDGTIPIELGRALFKLAPEPKEIVPIKGAGHSNIYVFGALAYVKSFIDRQWRR